MTILVYPKCSTCRNALAWLDGKGAEYAVRDIVNERPSQDELKLWLDRSGLPIKKFFNASGMLYRELGLKDKLPDMSEEEQLKLLASNGMLVKRPLLVSEKGVIPGFKAADWEKLL